MFTIKIDNPNKVGKTTVKKIAKILAEGRIAILPASTIYGLSCRYDNKDSLEKIYKIKKRNKNLPLIILIARIDDLENLASDINQTAKKIVKKFWDIKNPRPLTLIFKRNSSLKKFITSGSPNIAVRLAGFRYLRNIISICGPIVSTSATVSGIKGYPSKIEDISDSIKKQVDLIVECSSCLGGSESTVIDVTDEIPAQVREGMIEFRDVLKSLNNKKI